MLSFNLFEDSFEKFLDNYSMKFNPFQDKIAHDDIFIGKDNKALIRIFRAIRNNQSSISLLIGPTGSGKSENADYVVRNLPEEYVFWYNQMMKHTHRQLAISIIKDIDPNFAGKLNSREEVLRAFNMLLEALPLQNKKLLCIFDQGEHFSKDALEFIVNSTNPRAGGIRPFSAIILAVPRFETRLKRWMKYYDTTLKRILVKEYIKPFTPEEGYEYIARALAASIGIEFEDIVRKNDLTPFEISAVELLVELSQGHPSTLTDLCYLSLEAASETSSEQRVNSDIVEEVWEKYNNKELHSKAVEWYREKGFYKDD